MKVPLLDTPMLMISAGAACNQNHSSGTIYDVLKKNKNTWASNIMHVVIIYQAPFHSTKNVNLNTHGS